MKRNATAKVVKPVSASAYNVAICRPGETPATIYLTNSKTHPWLGDVTTARSFSESEDAQAVADIYEDAQVVPMTCECGCGSYQHHQNW